MSGIIHTITAAFHMLTGSTTVPEEPVVPLATLPPSDIKASSVAHLSGNLERLTYFSLTSLESKTEICEKLTALLSSLKSSGSEFSAIERVTSLFHSLLTYSPDLVWNAEVASSFEDLFLDVISSDQAKEALAERVENLLKNVENFESAYAAIEEASQIVKELIFQAVHSSSVPAELLNEITVILNEQNPQNEAEAVGVMIQLLNLFQAHRADADEINKAVGILEVLAQSQSENGAIQKVYTSLRTWLSQLSASFNFAR